MTTPQGPDPELGRSDDPRPGRDADADELAADIARIRQRLGDTADALSEKLDVKAQAKHSAQEMTHRLHDQSREAKDQLGAAATRARSSVTDQQGEPKPWIIAGAALALVGVIVGSAAVLRRRRTRAAGTSRRSKGRR